MKIYRTEAILGLIAPKEVKARVGDDRADDDSVWKLAVRQRSKSQKRNAEARQRKALEETEINTVESDI